MQVYREAGGLTSRGIALNTDNYTDLLKNLPAEITLRFLNRAPQQTPENFEAYLNAMHVDTLTFAVLEKYAENPNYLTRSIK